MITPEQIKTERLKLGLSQEMLAYISGVSCRTVFNVENNRTTPSAYTLIAIENALNQEKDRDAK